MDNADPYKRGQDLIFQEIDEQERLDQQALPSSEDPAAGMWDAGDAKYDLEVSSQ
jgi:hypothetical protein